MADGRVAAAISHWAPRFIANGIDYSDFVAVTSKISTWDSWCEHWCEAGAVHEELGRVALADGSVRAAGAHFAQAAGSSSWAPYRCCHKDCQRRLRS